MSDDEDANVPSKRLKLEEAPEGSGGVGGSVPTSRWSSATLQLYASDRTPRMGDGGQSAWRGMATPSATPYAESIPTPSFGISATTPGMGGRTPHMGGRTPHMGGRTPGMVGATPLYAGGVTPQLGQTPGYQFEGTTPQQSHFVEGAAMSATNAAIEAEAKRLEKEWRLRNRQLTSEFLDDVLPSEEYFTVLPAPPEYNPAPLHVPNFHELAVQTMKTFDFTPREDDTTAYDIPDDLGPGMPAMRPEDAKVFVELLMFHGVDPIPDENLPSYLLMKNLFKIKNGDSLQRRAGTKFLLEKASVLGSNFIFKRIFSIWRSDTLDLQAKHFYVEFIKTLVMRMGTEAKSSATEVVHMMQPLLTAADPIMREDGRQALLLLTRVLGFDEVYAVIRDDFAHERHDVRRHTAKVMAIIGTASPTLRPVLMALHSQSRSTQFTSRQTVALSISELASLCGHSILGALPDIVPVLEYLLGDEKRVRRDAATAVARVADAVNPFGIEEMAPLVNLITAECSRGVGTVTAPFLTAFGSLVPLMAPSDAQERTTAMMPTLVRQFNTPEDDHRCVLLTVVQKCVSAEGVTPGFIREVILEPFFDGFWSPNRASVATDRRSFTLLVQTTLEIAKKLGPTDILERLYREMKDEREQFQQMVLLTVRKVIEAVGTEAASQMLMAYVLDGAVTVVRQDVEGTNSAGMECLAAACVSLGRRLKQFVKQIFELIRERRERPQPAVRAQAAYLVSRIAPAVMQAEGGVFLEDIGRSLYERLEDDDAGALRANIVATRVVLSVLGAERYKPSVRDLLKKLTFVIHNRETHVQLRAVQLIEDIATKYDQEVDPVHLHELATKNLFELLDASNRLTRRCCTRTFGIIAKKIHPFSIVLKLINNLRQDKRSIRVCTAVALGSIASSCGAFTVIPYLLNEYRISEGEQVAIIVQHSVLKAIRAIFEQIGSAGADYVYAILPLLQRALTESSVQMRRMGVEAARAVVMAVAGQPGFEPVAVHLLNYVHPNIVELLSKNQSNIAEERLKMVTSVVSFYEAAWMVLGAGPVLQYLIQGLYHPASKVRDIYRRTYNMVYMLSPEALVPYYPSVPDDASHRYQRHELLVLP